MRNLKLDVVFSGVSLVFVTNQVDVSLEGALTGVAAKASWCRLDSHYGKDKL